MMMSLGRSAPTVIVFAVHSTFLLCACSQTATNAPNAPYLSDAGPNDSGTYPLGQGGGPAASTNDQDAGAATTLTATGTTGTINPVHDAGATDTGSGTDGGGDDASSSDDAGCSFSVSLVGSGSFQSGTCSVTAGNSGQGMLFILTPTSLTAPFQFQADLSGSSTLSTGTYSTRNVTSASGSTSAPGTAYSWSMSYDNAPTADTGSFSLIISSTGKSPAYTPHGTLSVTLTETADASVGSAVASAQF